ncbi:MAG: hypothetical protein J6C46_08840 [Clostridia bacterium]|nr:hypothetical protein [Clostridia bacterium]
MGYLPREPRVDNKYSLNISDIVNLKIGNRNLIGSPLFWWNNAVSMWCISGQTSGSCENKSFWFGIFTEKTPVEHKQNTFFRKLNNTNEFAFNFSSCYGTTSYNFKHFFDPKEITGEESLEIQEKFLESINKLIDLGILVHSDKQK